MKKSGTKPSIEALREGLSPEPAAELVAVPVGQTGIEIHMLQRAQLITDRIWDDNGEISGKFDTLIDRYAVQGYMLHSWSLSVFAAPGRGIVDIIVAVFESKE